MPRDNRNFWYCNVCNAQNSRLDGECQFCECGGLDCKRDNCSAPEHFHADHLSEGRASNCALCERGFSLIELMISVVIIGTLAAICIPNFIAMQDRAKEAHVKANQHTAQLMAETFNVDHSFYPRNALELMGGIPMAEGGMTLVDPPTPADAFANPFSHESGEGSSWEDRTGEEPTPIPGIVSYRFFGGDYDIKGRGKHATLSLVLVSGGGQ